MKNQDRQLDKIEALLLQLLAKLESGAQLQLDLAPAAKAKVAKVRTGRIARVTLRSTYPLERRMVKALEACLARDRAHVIRRWLEAGIEAPVPASALDVTPGAKTTATRFSVYLHPADDRDLIDRYFAVRSDFRSTWIREKLLAGFVATVGGGH